MAERAQVIDAEPAMAAQLLRTFAGHGQQLVAGVGWVERSETHQRRAAGEAVDGFRYRSTHPTRSGLMASTAYSIDAPENRTAFAHFSVSDAITLPKSAGVPVIGMPPRSASRSFILGSASASLTVLLIFSMILAGVPLGAPMPNQALAS